MSLHSGQWNQKNMSLSGSLQAKQAATLATTSTSMSEHLLATSLSKWWDMESSGSNCDVTDHSKDEQKEVKKLEQKARFTNEWYEFGILWREDEMKLPNKFYSAMR